MSALAVRACVLALCTAAAIASPRVASAQQRSALEQVEAAIVAGRLTEARAALERWQRARARSAAGDERALGLLLQARLAPDLDSARDGFLEIVLAHPSSAAAPEALLRLGQGLTLAGEPARAAAYLERLAADYPGAAQRTEALAWLARAYRSAGQRTAACASARRAAAGGPANVELETLIDLELDAACASGSNGAPNAAGAAAVTRVDTATAARTAAAKPHDIAGRFSVQAGAFREQGGAARSAAALRDAGFNARVVAVAGSTLHRVRIGRFDTTSEAAVLAGRLTALGYTVIIVDDALQERP